jgi:hypothetical protein
MARKVILACVVFASVLLAAGTWAGAGTGLGRVPVVVTPSSGSPLITFTLSFRAQERTGLYGSSQRHDLVVASASPGQGGCVTTLSVHAHDAQTGARVRVRLVPGNLGGRWCVGRYSGRIEEIQTAVCPHGTLCPTYVLLRGIVGRFTFHVIDSNDKTPPPTFAGLQEAFACTPGPQQPGQTTPYTLSWQPASDNSTPSAQITYDVYLASAPGAEDFSTPTWTTPPGVTSYRTPGLPSHGSYYFVVRARDNAGNQDANTVEKHGIDPCY